jgi:hypothetical protein
VPGLSVLRYKEPGLAKRRDWGLTGHAAALAPASGESSPTSCPATPSSDTHDLLREAGFTSVVTIQKYLFFEGILAIK